MARLISSMVMQCSKYPIAGAAIVFGSTVMPRTPRSPNLAPEVGGEVVAAVDLGRAGRDLVGGEGLHARAQHVRGLAQVEIQRGRAVQQACGHAAFPFVFRHQTIMRGASMTTGPGQISYVHGAREVPLLGETLGQNLDRTAARHPDQLALIVRSQGVRWTYAELVARAEAFAAGLLALGLQRGDRVGIWSLNNAEWLVVQFATAKAGLILVNINPAYRLAELEFALNKVRARALVTATRFKTSDYIGMLSELAPELAASKPGALHAARLPHLRTVIQIGGQSPGAYGFDDVAGLAAEKHRAELARLQTLLQFDDPINIQFTSGTTGSPKGATLTHHNILNNGFFIGEAMRLSHQDRLCIPVPLYHCFGMVLGNLACTTHGATMVYPGEGFDPLSVLETVSAERCTGLHGVRPCSSPNWNIRIRQLRPVQLADGDHGRLPMPHRGDAPRRGPHAPDGDHDLLRHDGNQPGQLPELGGRPAGPPGQHGRTDPSAPGGEGHRRGRPRGAARRRGRAVHPRLQRDDRLLG